MVTLPRHQIKIVIINQLTAAITLHNSKSKLIFWLFWLFAKMCLLRGYLKKFLYKLSMMYVSIFRHNLSTYAQIQIFLKIILKVCSWDFLIKYFFYKFLYQILPLDKTNLVVTKPYKKLPSKFVNQNIIFCLLEKYSNVYLNAFLWYKIISTIGYVIKIFSF